MQQDFLDKELLANFQSMEELPFSVPKTEASLLIVNDILFRGDSRILFVVDRIDLLHLYGKLFSYVCNSVGVVYGELQEYYKKVTILSSSSFQTRSARLSGYDAIIFETFSNSKINTLIRDRYKSSAIIGLTDTLVGYTGSIASNKSSQQINENNMKLLDRIKSIFKKTSQKDIFDAFEVDFVKKELIWFKGNNSLSIKISDKERFIFFEDLQFKNNKLVQVNSSLVRVFGSLTSNYEVIEGIKTRGGAYEYVLKAANGSSSVENMYALRGKILKPGAYMKASRSQISRISFLMSQIGKDYLNINIPEVEITSKIAIVLIAGLEEKRFKTTAIFGRLKKNFIADKKKIINIEIKDEILVEEKFTPKETEMINSPVTLETLKNRANDKLKNKLLDLSIELVQEEDSESKKLTLELLKYLKNK